MLPNSQARAIALLFALTLKKTAKGYAKADFLGYIQWVAGSILKMYWACLA
ncbi:MAG: hypothetical protein ACOC43_02690 [Desulfohalobiaceae bacterium]